MEEVTYVLQAEQEADKILAQAIQDAEQILHKAKAAAVERVAQGKEEIRQALNVKLQQDLKKAEQERQRILEEAKKEFIQLQKTALKHQDKAVQLLLQEILADLADVHYPIHGLIQGGRR